MHTITCLSVHYGSHDLQVSVSVDGNIETVSCGSHDSVEEDNNQHLANNNEENGVYDCSMV